MFLFEVHLLVITTRLFMSVGTHSNFLVFEKKYTQMGQKVPWAFTERARKREKNPTSPPRAFPDMHTRKKGGKIICAHDND